MYRTKARSIASAVIFAAVVALAVSHSPRPASAQEILDGIAAVVNSDVITYSQMRNLVRGQEEAARSRLTGQELVNKIKSLRLAAINHLIDRELLLQELKRRGSPVRRETTDQSIDQIIKTQFSENRKTWLEKLRRSAYIKIY